MNFSKAFVALCMLVALVAAQRCAILPKDPVPPVIKTKLPHSYINLEEIPTNLTWCDMAGENFCSSSRNQHIPQYCGSCWAMAATSSIADRIRIVRKSRFPDFEIAVQTAVYCLCSGCGGGSAEEVYQYMYSDGLGPDTCRNYVAEGDGSTCTPIHRCQNCFGFNATRNPCTAVNESQYPNFHVSEHGTVTGVEEMMTEIYARGPIACYVNAGPIWDWGFGPNKTAIFSGCSGQKDPAKCAHIDHVISVVGFGLDDATGEKYWIIRNSWGEYWGAFGFFRLKMGDNQLGIETTPCAWAVPSIPPPPGP